MKLYAKELRHAMSGILYLVFVGAMVLFYVTQFGNAAGRDIAFAEGRIGEGGGYNLLQPPRPGQEYYGSEHAEVPEQVVPYMLRTLLTEYDRNTYLTYRYGFGRTVRLNEGARRQVADVFVQLTGFTFEELSDMEVAWYEANTSIDPETKQMTLAPGADPNNALPGIVVEYEVFREEMAGLDKLLGGYSQYDPAGFAYRGERMLTYEEALVRHRELLEGDRITGAYARYMSDYMGIALGMFAVFVPVGFLMRDRRANMQQLVFSRAHSSAAIVCARYAACLTAVMLPVLVLSVVPTVQLVAYGVRSGLGASPFGFLKYMAGWLLPTAMATCSVGFFFTTLTGTPVGIVVQFLWCISEFFGSMYKLQGGNYGTSLMLRHNQIGGWHLVDAARGTLLANRLAYTGLALVMLACSVLFYELQRRGRLDVRGAVSAVFRRGKNTIPADAAV